MAAYNPYFNEDTGWADASQMEPWQQAMMNPSGGQGFSTAGVNPSVISQINGYSSNVNNGGGGNNWMSPFENMSAPAPSGQYTPSTGTGLYPGMPQSPGYTAPGGGTNTPPPATIASPALMANSMGMQGAGTQNVNGQIYGSYTQGNAPLNSQLFNQQAGNMSPQLDYVRNIDQVSYYKYVLPLQQAGLIDVANPQQVQAAIQQGMARDGGGQYAQGSNVSGVQGSPYSKFLQSGDPRAQAINQFMLQGGNAVTAAQDWMSKNVRQDGSTASPLDNIDAWKQRFSSIYFPNQQFNPSAITSNGAPPPGGQQTPPPGGTIEPDNSAWYQEYTAQNPNSRVQYNKQLDQWAAQQLSPSQRAQFEGKTDPQTLTAYRKALDAIRTGKGYMDWGSINPAALNNNAQTSWLSEGYENAPFSPGSDPGQYFRWDWADADPNDKNNPNNWYLRMNNPQGYQDVQAALQYYNQNLRQNGANIIDNPYFVRGQDGQYVPVSQSMFNYMGNSPWQSYNRQVNEFLSPELDPNLTANPFSLLTDDAATQQYLQAIDNIRRQRGYMTNSGVMGMAQQPGNVPLNSFVGSPAGTPFRPNATPGQGFAWEWMDDDGTQGATPGTWGQRLIGTPSNIQQATQYADYMSQNSGFRFNGGSNFGNMFSQENVPTGGFKWTPKTSFFTPQQTTPPPGGGQNTTPPPDFSSWFSSNYQTPAPLFSGTGTGTGSGTGSGSGTGTGTGTGTGSGTSNTFNPWGNASRNTNKFANNFNYYGW